MTNAFLPVLRAFLLLVLTPAAAFAQTDAPAPHDPAWQLTPYVGVARHSPAGNFLGSTPDLNHLFAGIHITVTVARAGRWSLAYAPEVVPLLLLSDTPTYHADGGTTDDGFPNYVVDGQGSVAGIGVSPVGFEVRLRAGAGWRLYAATAAGFLKFTRSTPVPEARAFNYSFEYGGGVEVQVRPDWWLRVGYKFHHFSNGFSAEENPGVDGHVWLVGVGRAFGRR
jgi:opacity protein-like surface antigen